jgi:hypothetical protein
VIIDSSHRRWAATSGVLLVLASAAFLFQPRSALGWDAGKGLGLAFGVLAFLIFLFEVLLAVRRSRPAWHLGRVATWARAHVWLGVLGFAFALLHAGFRARGTVSLTLMVVLVAVTASGLVGLLLHQLVPRWLTALVPRETIEAQIPSVVRELKKEAEALVAAAEDEALTRFYQEEVDSFLGPNVRGHRLLSRERAIRLFSQVEKRLAPSSHEALTDLKDICEERAQLFTQARLQSWLKGWLFFHVPLSLVVVVLTAAHAIMTLLY